MHFSLYHHHRMSTIKFEENLSLHSLNWSYLDEYPDNHYVCDCEVNNNCVSLCYFRTLKLLALAYAQGLALAHLIMQE